MRIIRYETQDSKKPKYGWILNDKVGEIGGNVFGRYRRKEAETPLADVKLLAPSMPGKIICVGRNYVEHAKELGNEVPKVPLIFMKPPSSIINPNDTIILPPQSTQVEHEGELVAVIGKRCRNVSPAEASASIFGWTIGNDITERDWQKNDPTNLRGKNADTFKPMGPWIATGIEPRDMTTVVRLNGATVHSFPTGNMLFSAGEVISDISRTNTLSPGDVVWLGTDELPQSLKAGDTIEVEISGIGVLRNRVVAEA